MKCDRVMDFYHKLDDKHDRYDCPCGEDRWVLKEFTPRNKEVPKEEEIKADRSDIREPVDVAILMESITEEVRNETLLPSRLEEFIIILASSEMIFHYFVKCYELYNYDADVRIIMHQVHERASRKFSFYNKANDRLIAHTSNLNAIYPVNIVVSTRPSLPDPARAERFLDHIFSFL